MPSVVVYDKWLSGLGGGEVVACSMARVLKDTGFDVTLVSQTKVKPEAIMKTLNIDIKDIQLEIINDNENQLKQLCKDKDLFINISFMDYSYGYAKKNVYYVHFPTIEKKGGYGGLGLFNCVLTFFQKTNLQSLLPNPLKERIDDRLRAGIYPNLKKRLNSYQIFITHSEYVAKWVKKAWDINAKVLYPPVSLLTTNHQPLTTKLNWICSVGRFFTLGHGKKQEVMIEAFKQLFSELTTNHYPLTTNLQLHLIGGVGTEPSSIRFVEKLHEMAKGYPIFFHFNVPRSEVENILLKSKIYWHAAGYGEDPEKNPIKFEHFGIAPVEAISAGCIPILYNGGGLTEIISVLGLNKKDNLFNTQEELVTKTKHLMGNLKQIDSFPSHKLGLSFSQSSFKKNFLSILHEG